MKPNNIMQIHERVLLWELLIGILVTREVPRESETIVSAGAHPSPSHTSGS